jgi:hypothetical protein
MSVLGWADERRKKEEKLKEERLDLEKKEKLKQKEITEKLNSISFIPLYRCSKSGLNKGSWVVWLASS